MRQKGEQKLLLLKVTVCVPSWPLCDVRGSTLMFVVELLMILMTVKVSI